MTNEEIIKVLRSVSCSNCSWGCDSPITCNCSSCELKEATKYVIDMLQKPKIIICKDCKWWDSDSKIIGYCNACKHSFFSGSWEIGIFRRTRDDFYCADGEMRDEKD